MNKWFKKVAIKTIKTMAQTAVGLIFYPFLDKEDR